MARTVPFARDMSLHRAQRLPCLLMCLAGLVLVVGCGQKQSPPAAQTAGLSQPTTQPTATADPTAGLLPHEPQPALQVLSPLPAGWMSDPPKHTSEHDHQAWLSPTGRTAYGVIAFRHWLLPLANDQMVLDRFLQTMRESEGEGRLVGKPQADPKLGGLRFTAEGGQYVVRGNLVTRGARGWVVYAGTLRNQPVMPDELELAVRARENTILGLQQQQRQQQRSQHVRVDE